MLYPKPERCRSASCTVTEDRGGWAATCSVCGGEGWGIAPVRAERAVRHKAQHALPASAESDFDRWEREMKQ